MKMSEKNILHICHNAGFFSCCSVRLQEIMIWYNIHQRLPDQVDSTKQFAFYKPDPTDETHNIVPHYFKDGLPEGFPYMGRADITRTGQDPQYSDYGLLEFEETKLFLEKYFSLSENVEEKVKFLEEKYQIDYDNTIALFYRGNDKNRETTIGSYDEFIIRTSQIYESGMRILVQPDETEFLEECYRRLPGVFHFEETPHMRKKDSTIFFEMPHEDRLEYGAWFLAAVVVMSKCRKLVTHSGNGGLWAALFRGHGKEIYQWLGDKWLR